MGEGETNLMVREREIFYKDETSDRDKEPSLEIIKGAKKIAQNFSIAHLKTKKKHPKLVPKSVRHVILMRSDLSALF